MTASAPRDVLAVAEGIPTTVLADALRDAGLPDQVVSTGLRQVTGPRTRVAGWACTVVGGLPVPGEAGPDHRKAEAIDRMPADSIAVWAGGVSPDVCLFGDLLALGMQVRGVRGALVDGAVRDAEDLDEAAFPVVARGLAPRASTGFWRARDAQVPVRMPGIGGASVEVVPGDLVVIDGTGVVVVPAHAVGGVLEAAQARTAQEEQVRARILGGERLADLLQELGRL